MKLLREPLLHFVAAGAILFAAQAWWNRDGADADAVDAVRITEGDVRWLVETWRGQWLREPQPASEGMIADLVEERFAAKRSRWGQQTIPSSGGGPEAPSWSRIRQGWWSPGGRASLSCRACDRQTGATVSFTQAFNPSGATPRPMQGDAGRSMATILRPNLGDRLLVEATSAISTASRSSIFGPVADAVLALALDRGAAPSPRATDSTSFSSRRRRRRRRSRSTT
jgi:hypothetical protein